jgi:hypothetical protein
VVRFLQQTSRIYCAYLRVYSSAMPIQKARKHNHHTRRECEWRMSHRPATVPWPCGCGAVLRSVRVPRRVAWVSSVMRTVMFLSVCFQKFGNFIVCVAQ